MALHQLPKVRAHTEIYDFVGTPALRDVSSLVQTTQTSALTWEHLATLPPDDLMFYLTTLSFNHRLEWFPHSKK